jgi:hypothetical protein
MDPVNNIMQPGDLDGLGNYHIRASVPSPVIHSLCVTLTKTQLEPFVYELWPAANVTPVDLSTWPMQLGNGSGYDLYLNGTDLDDVFRWGPKYGEYKWPPVFAKLPQDFNTIINDTSKGMYGRQSVYMLGKGGPLDPVGSSVENENYALCQLLVSQTPFCSTSYNASASGAQLAAICEDDQDELQYHRSIPDARGGNFSIQADWPNIVGSQERNISTPMLTSSLLPFRLRNGREVCRARS